MQFKSISKFPLIYNFRQQLFWGVASVEGGAKRDGVYTGTFDASLISQSSLDWESGTIPSGDEGGFGSLIVTAVRYICPWSGIGMSRPIQER